MNQFLMTVGLLVAMLIVYLNVVDSSNGIRANSEKSHNKMTEYARSIDA